MTFLSYLGVNEKLRLYFVRLFETCLSDTKYCNDYKLAEFCVLIVFSESINNPADTMGSSRALK